MTSRESWRSRLGFAVAAMGSAVGLASIVRFPYLVADHGGAAFIAVYLLSLFIVGIPTLWAEVSLGCATQKNCYEAFAVKGERGLWKGAGLWVLFTALSLIKIRGWPVSFHPSPASSMAVCQSAMGSSVALRPPPKSVNT